MQSNENRDSKSRWKMACEWINLPTGELRREEAAKLLLSKSKNTTIKLTQKDMAKLLITESNRSLNYHVDKDKFEDFRNHVIMLWKCYHEGQELSVTEKNILDSDSKYRISSTEMMEFLPVGFIEDALFNGYNIFTDIKTIHNENNENN